MYYSLPVSIKNSYPLGYWLTPILVDSLSKQTGENGIFCYGRLGLRAPSLEEGLFNSNLDLLGIDCKRVTDYVLQTVLSDFALQAYNSDRISFRNQECFVCSCGALSIPVEIVKYAKQKTFRLNDGVPCCKVCEKDAKITSVRILVYTTKFKTTFKSIKVYPCLYQTTCLIQKIC
jgi:hypothetical protein